MVHSCSAAPGTDYTQLGELSDAELTHDGLGGQAAALGSIGAAPTNTDSRAAVHQAADARPPFPSASWAHLAAAAICAGASFLRIGR